MNSVLWRGEKAMNNYTDHQQAPVVESPATVNLDHINQLFRFCKVFAIVIGSILCIAGFLILLGANGSSYAYMVGQGIGYMVGGPIFAFFFWMLMKCVCGLFYDIKVSRYIAESKEKQGKDNDQEK